MDRKKQSNRIEMAVEHKEKTGEATKSLWIEQTHCQPSPISEHDQPLVKSLREDKTDSNEKEQNKRARISTESLPQGVSDAMRE